eukprot:Skav228925  [mRNA]  locus=scaffold3800:119059:122378:+ [translate_table: standard]
MISHDLSGSTCFSGYIPYLARAKRLWLSTHRYIAYSSDVGESLRPVIKPWKVNLSYGIAGAYVLADTGLAGYRKQQQNCPREEVAAACAHTLVFQTVASLALPADAWRRPGAVGRGSSSTRASTSPSTSLTGRAFRSTRASRATDPAPWGWR